MTIFYNNAPLGSGSFTILDFTDPMFAIDLGGGVAGFSVKSAAAAQLGVIKLAGDLGDGGSGGNSPIVVGITGSGAGGAVPVHCDEITWDDNIAEPSLIQAQDPGSGAGIDMFIGAQNAGATAAVNTIGGYLVLAGGHDPGVTGGTHHSGVKFQSNAVNIAGFYEDSAGNTVLHMDIENRGAPAFIFGPSGNGLSIGGTGAGATLHLKGNAGIVFEDTNASAALTLTPNHAGNNLITYPSAANSGSLELTCVGNGIGSARYRMTATGVSWFDNSPFPRPAAYTITNATTRRTMDETAITLVQLANFVGTLAGDLGAGQNAASGYGLFL